MLYTKSKLEYQNLWKLCIGTGWSTKNKEARMFLAQVSLHKFNLYILLHHYRIAYFDLYYAKVGMQTNLCQN